MSLSSTTGSTTSVINEYYSLADVTLCIGSCVETFGNTPFESLGCGTLPIVSRVGPYRDLLPDEHIARVDYGDIQTTAAIAHEILTERRRTVRRRRCDTCNPHFAQTAMVSAYADVILNARKKAAADVSPAADSRATRSIGWRLGVIPRRSAAFTTTSAQIFSRRLTSSG